MSFSLIWKTQYVLYGLKGNEYKLEERIRNDFSKNNCIFVNQYSNKPIEFDFSSLIVEWDQQLPRIALMYGIILADDQEHDTPYNGVCISGHPLFNEFRMYFEGLMKRYPNVFLNPFVKQEEFDKKAKSFIKERKELIDEIVEIVTEKIGNKIYKVYECIEIGHIKIPIELIQGILARLNFGAKWEYSNFSDRWFNDFMKSKRENPDLQVWDESHGL